MSSNLERDAELDVVEEYVNRAAKTVARWLTEHRFESREQGLGRFQIADDVIWSPEIYHRIQAALDKLRPRVG